MLLKIDHGSSQPLHDQVAGQLRAAIATGDLPAGERLPPARDLAAGLGVNCPRDPPHTSASSAASSQYWVRARTSINLENIDAATAIGVRPMQWGGWGYRGGLRLAKQAAVVIRAGTGLRLDLTRGRVFVLTVDDAGAAAALLTAEIARRSNDRATAQPSDKD